jgi:acetolactate synthase-1/2/3 large subunit
VHRFFRHHGLVKGHKTQLAPTVGSMGYGVPAGIAANIVTGRTAFTIAGDGDFLMNGQELATAVQHGGKSIIVLLNNGMYGTIRITRTGEFEPELLAALQRDTGTLIEVLLDPDVITTRGTLTAITEQALARSGV